MAKNTKFNLRDLINSIDRGESTEWAKEMQDISTDIRNSLLAYRPQLDLTHNFCFWDYCNFVKSLLIVYNFGSLDKSDQHFEEGRKCIKEGIVNILRYVGDGDRYDISGSMLSAEECQEIFSEDGKCVPVTVSLTSVFTTLVYLRRAMKRNDLFTKEELDKDNPGLYDKIVETVGDIMVMLQDYVSQNGFRGWGFTIKSKQVSLSDTYAVVDAISRYLDAFTKEGKEDKEFTSAVDAVQQEKHGADYKNISDWLLSSMYKVAFTTYDNSKSVYGQSIFYANGGQFSATDIEQISNSSRSSALFNPLYIAMITMYGYNDKEIVIRKFMDDNNLANRIYRKYEVNDKGEGDREISAYLDEKPALYNKSQFLLNVDKLKTSHENVSYDYSDNAKWKSYYQLARVFQKFLEEKHPDELFRINEYRDYYNATKDAIDQVQVMYRKFDDKQKLGIVDTDYVMFSRADVETEAVNISKLNKANIAVNSLRPLLLSSKIMIVNALTHYPQSDMADLFVSIKETRYRKSTKSKQDDWLWNEDRVDMNSTMRHCESIAYDYFDYYENYELGFKAISSLKNNAGEISIDVESGNIEDKNDVKAQNDGADDKNVIKKLIMDMTRLNMNKVNDAYRVGREALKKEFEDEIKRLKEGYEEALKEKDRLIEEQCKENELIKVGFEEKKKLLAADNVISATLKEWIREEAYSYILKLLSCIVIKTINGRHIDFNKLKKDKVYHADFESAANLLKELKAEHSENPEATEAEYNVLAQRSDILKDILEAVSNGAMESTPVQNGIQNAGGRSEDNEYMNKQIRTIYDQEKQKK